MQCVPSPGICLTPHACEHVMPTNVTLLCRSKYEVCAEAMCAPGASADADGCITADDASANAGCQADFPSDCAPATCNRASLPEGGTGTGLDGSGCTRAPDVSLCVPDFPCQLPACSAEGVCSFTSSNEVCQCAAHDTIDHALHTWSAMASCCWPCVDLCSCRWPGCTRACACISATKM